MKKFFHVILFLAIFAATAADASTMRNTSSGLMLSDKRHPVFGCQLMDISNSDYHHPHRYITCGKVIAENGLYKMYCTSSAISDFLPKDTLDEYPSFKGGTKALEDYISARMRPHNDLYAKGIFGQVIIEFQISKKGVLSDSEVIQSVHPELDKEALEIAAGMPRWIPGRMNGKAVAGYSCVAVNYYNFRNIEEAYSLLRMHKRDFVVYDNVRYTLADAIDLEATLYKRGCCIDWNEIARIWSGLRYTGKSLHNLRPTKTSLYNPYHVTVEVTVDSAGIVRDATIKESLSPELDREAIRYISEDLKDKFTPASKSEKNVTSKILIEVPFKKLSCAHADPIPSIYNFDKSFAYPNSVKTSKSTDVVNLTATIRKDGSVDNLAIVGKAHPSLRKAALQTARQIKWVPQIDFNQTPDSLIKTAKDCDINFSISFEGDHMVLAYHDMRIDLLEHMPKFPNGTKSIVDFLTTHTHYPAVALENNVLGKATINFTIMKDGSIVADFPKDRSDPALMKESVRTVRLLPRFIPGKVNHKATSARMVANFYYHMPSPRKREGVISIK